ncbi:uncharacterized protein P174DRAFT_516256 [Aspergillus novofumigatus IBT 16806]|uniref:Uncharacterized protein n=1 Tax=Aspergillus novofumigatus (strain IBT 16806) TaxID=1392255 RepID=A0A2I1BUK6_ASPN1|nr:uncharacterized protein P174DRAFT_516256 [Aspergillus novofumigatus IBT 16806]PKX89083.1 hypothetical protein P174DRAFT_516256 [Aspergillus novofumigatus IBT 16806]
MGLRSSRSLSEYHDILHRDKYAILYFCNSLHQCASLDLTYNDMASARFCKPVPQQLEYMVSQALCEMTKISMVPYTEREDHGNLMYCIPAHK